MNRSALKTYAPKARLDFIRAVMDRAAFHGLTKDRTEPMEVSGDVVLIGGRAFPKAVAQQRRSLEDRIQRHGFDQVMEAMAYTWFNRFVALRYMELHGSLDHGYRVLSHPQGGTTPEIVEHAEHVTLPGLDPKQVIELKLNGGQDAALYRLLLVAQCNALHEAMPFLFEKIADETELLLPDNLLHSDSVIRKLVNEIEETDWQQVEIIGWLYQFYISDKKDAVIGKMVKSEDIPAATQLFTPNWIVKYLVQNTLGRQWLATYPNSPLRQKMEYYIEPADQTEEVRTKLAAITPKSLDPETLTLLDPASGSGHILVEAYDLFKAIYQERGYRSRDIPGLILEKNLFGLEIDDRAAQLAAFALLMKARADDRRIFAERIQPNIIAIQESKGLEGLLAPNPHTGSGDLPFTDSDMFPDSRTQLTLTQPAKGSPLAAAEPCLRELVRLFQHGKTFGSLIRVPPELAAQLPEARRTIEAMIETGQLWAHRAAVQLLPLVQQAELIAKTYDCVVTNPPYMGNKGMNAQLKAFLRDAYPTTKSDTFAAFVERSTHFSPPYGHVGMVTMHSWMFLSSYEVMREHFLRNKSIISMAHLGPRAFDSISGEVVQVTAFGFLNRHITGFKPTFFRLVAGSSEDKRLAIIAGQNKFCDTVQEDFSHIPGAPIAYWASATVRDIFKNSPNVGSVGQTKVGLQTGENDLFLRYWHEVSLSQFNRSAKSREDAKASGLKWFPCNKGGAFRKWFGNNDYVVNWKNDGEEIREDKLKKLAQGLILASNSKPKNPDAYFREGITWTTIATSNLSMRYSPQSHMFETKGAMYFCDDSIKLRYVMALANSVLANQFLSILSPTVDFHEGPFLNLPLILKQADKVSTLVDQCIALAKEDWNCFETSWDFKVHPCLSQSLRDNTVQSTYRKWDENCAKIFQKMKTLEETLNRLFIDNYGLTRELTPEVASDQITIFGADLERDMQHLASYAIGCMMGRYSLDKPGLVYAHNRNEGFDADQYVTFPADADGIVPITEIAWFEDDATERFVEFISKAWPSEHLEENLKFVADSLGPNRDEHPRDTTRRYLSTAFYKNHLSTYKKRPIYWLFSSGKLRAFQCLVYLHRYNEGTLARMRTEYVIPLQGKMSHRIEQLAGDILAATSTSHRRRLEKEREILVKQRAELAAFDEKLRHYADQRIALDLDDGVKVNYGKFGDLLAEVKAVTGGSEE